MGELSRTEDLLVTGVEETVNPLSRVEAILRGEEIKPLSRIEKDLINYHPGPGPTPTPSVIEISKDDYDALSDEEKNNGSVYKVTIPESGTQGLIALNHFDYGIDNDEVDGIHWVSQGANETFPFVHGGYKKFGNSSVMIYNWNHIYIAPNEKIQFYDQDFTIDLWIYPTYSGRNTIFSHAYDPYGGLGLAVDFWYSYVGNSVNQWMSSDNYNWNIVQSDIGGVDTSGIGSIEIEANKWQHIAMVRNGTSLRLYVDGKLAVETTIAATAKVYYDNRFALKFGIWENNDYPYTGFMDEICIRNYAVWTDEFTPPSQPYEKYIPAHDVLYFMSNEYDLEVAPPQPTGVFKDNFVVDSTKYHSTISDRMFRKNDNSYSAVGAFLYKPDEYSDPWIHPFCLLSETPSGASYVIGNSQPYVATDTIVVDGKTLYYAIPGDIYPSWVADRPDANFPIQMINGMDNLFVGYENAVRALAEAALR